MGEKFKEPKVPRFSIWPLITAGFASALALGMIPAGSGLFAADRLDGTGAGKLRREISYCRAPAVNSHLLGHVRPGRAKPVAVSDARKAT